MNDTEVLREEDRRLSQELKQHLFEYRNYCTTSVAGIDLKAAKYEELIKIKFFFAKERSNLQ